MSGLVLRFWMALLSSAERFEFLGRDLGKDGEDKLEVRNSWRVTRGWLGGSAGGSLLDGGMNWDRQGSILGLGRLRSEGLVAK